MRASPRKFAIVTLTALLLPMVSLALAPSPPPSFEPGTLGGIAGTILGILDIVVAIVMALALIYFFYGLGQYILSAGDDAKKAEGRNIMIYGVVALFVMVSVWGLVKVLKKTFISGVSTEGPNVNNLLPQYR